MQRSTTTDAQGRFGLAHLAAGKNQIAIRANGHAPTTKQVLAAPDMGIVEIELQPSRTISGKVVDHQNKPIPGANVSFDPGDFPEENYTSRPMTFTDGNGHFQLDITDDPGSLVAHHLMAQATRLLLPSDREVTIELRTQPVLVRGEVTDSQSGQPIPSFTVVKQGLMMGRTPMTGGRYKIEWTNATLPLHGSLWIGIEAEGYATTEFRRVPSSSGRDEIVMNFRLHRASPVVGTIRAPDGAPLAGAEIGVSSSAQEPEFRLQFQIDKAHIIPNTDQYVPMKTDATGRFTFPVSEGDMMMLATHPLGFAIRRKAQLVGDSGSPINVVLEPWGRVEGALSVGSRPVRGESVLIRSARHGETPGLWVRQQLNTRTDDQGRFAFDHLLPGLVRLEHSLKTTWDQPVASAPVPALAVKSGRTTRLELGRTGRPVIGHLTFPEEIKARAGKRLGGTIAYRPQPPRSPGMLTSEESRRWAQEEENTSRYYGLAIRPDGSFRADVVPPGNYEIEATVWEQDPEDPRRTTVLLGTAQHPIVVPGIQGASGNSSDPFDVGSMPIKLRPHLDVGRLAPDFQATALDGKPVRLQDFRGKYLLIVFWSKSYRFDVSLDESRTLRALYKTFGKVGRFGMLGINYDMEMDRFKVLVNQRGWDWLNASVSSEVWSKLLDQYSLPRYGSVWLIGPDGKVLARDLRGDAIKQAGTMVLRAR
jgi:peroxiredoxin/protocatechuate 3,4-dioxygenase beta subunit